MPESMLLKTKLSIFAAFFDLIKTIYIKLLPNILLIASKLLSQIEFEKKMPIQNLSKILSKSEKSSCQHKNTQ